nr:MAG TPA: hypothetical protein [Caudoviricetes sp.]
MKTTPGNIVAKNSFDRDIAILLDRYTVPETKVEFDDIYEVVDGIVEPTRWKKEQR